MPQITPQAVAVGVGAAGALVDVTALNAGPEGVTYSYGPADGFSATPPSIFSLTLENQDGRFTPGNTAAAVAAGYAATLTEGMQVSWQLGTRIVRGTIRSILPATDAANWGRLTIVCDDMLGDLGRFKFGADFGASVALGQAYDFWPMSDAGLSGTAVDVSASGAQPFVMSGSGVATFGIAPPSVFTGTQVDLSAAAAASGSFACSPPAGFAVVTDGIPGTQLGQWGMWVTPMNSTSFFEFGSGRWGSTWKFGIQNSSFVFFAGSTSTYSIVSSPFIVGQPYYWSSSLSGKTLTFYINGVAVASDTVALLSNVTPTVFTIGNASYGASQVRVGQVYFGPQRYAGETAGITTEAARVSAICSAVPTVTLGTVGALSSAAIGPAHVSGSGLDALNDVIKTEQGYVYTTTTGTLLSPTQSITVRERTRPATATYTFDVSSEISDVPSLVRDITNAASTVTVTGPDNSVRVVDTSSASRGGTVSETVELESSVDLTAWGQDRILRGNNLSLRLASVSIDAMTTPTDRSADLLAIKPGDRLSLTGLPSAVLGFSSLDGLVLGASESHPQGPQAAHVFTFRCAIVLAATGIYDTDLYANGGNNTISTTLTNVATSMLCTSADVVTLFETSAMNYYLLVDSEVVKVTACSAPVAGVQTLTITRAQFGTAAAAHAVGAVPEVYADSTGRLNNGTYAF